MASFATAFGLGSSTSLVAVPNYAPYFLIFGFLWTNAVSSARLLKMIYGIDYMVAPREGVSRYGEQKVKDGKMTRAQLDLIKRNEAAHANAFEAFPPFIGAVILAVVAGVANARINRICLQWTLLRVGYHIAYLAVQRGPLKVVRGGVFFWGANFTVISLLWQSATALNSKI